LRHLEILRVKPNLKPAFKSFNQHIITGKIERMTKQVAHPMMKLQRKVSSLVESKIVKPDDRIGKIALLLGNDWLYWKNELQDFDFSTQDQIQELLSVEDWDEN
jgi:hypothetical protein